MFSMMFDVSLLLLRGAFCLLPCCSPSLTFPKKHWPNNAQLSLTTSVNWFSIINYWLSRPGILRSKKHHRPRIHRIQNVELSPLFRCILFLQSARSIHQLTSQKPVLFCYPRVHFLCIHFRCVVSISIAYCFFYQRLLAGSCKSEYLKHSSLPVRSS